MKPLRDLSTRKSSAPRQTYITCKNTKEDKENINQRRSVKVMPRPKPKATSVTKQMAFADITNLKRQPLSKSLTKRKLDFVESKLNSDPNSNRNSLNGLTGISSMDKEQLQKKLQ